MSAVCTRSGKCMQSPDCAVVMTPQAGPGSGGVTRGHCRSSQPSHGARGKLDSAEAQILSNGHHLLFGKKALDLIFF